MECQAEILHVGRHWGPRDMVLLLPMSLIPDSGLGKGYIVILACVTCWEAATDGKPTGGCHRSGCDPSAASRSPPVLLVRSDGVFV